MNRISIHKQANFIQWSPDGDFLVFDFDEVFGRDEAIWMVSIDGSSLSKVVDTNPRLDYNTSMFGFHADLSPDGRRIAYSTCEHDLPNYYGSSAGDEPDRFLNHDVAIANIDGSSSRRLTGDGYENYPAWSPDGTRIAYLSETGRPLLAGSDGRVGVVRAAPAEEAPEAQWHGEWVAPYKPAWSPDGRHLALVRFEADWEAYERDGNVERFYRTVLYVPEAHGPGAEGAVLGITKTPPAWSPDGTWIAFASGDHQGSSIHVAHPDGSEALQIWEGEDDVSRLEWHPDGSEILVVSRRHPYSEKLWAINPEGNEARVLLPEESPLWTMKGHRYPERSTEVAWSPDGSRIAARSPWEHRDWRGRANVPNFLIFTMSREGDDLRLLAMGDEGRSAGFRVCAGAPLQDITQGTDLDSCIPINEHNP